MPGDNIPLGVITGGGTEESTIANERSSLLCLASFMAFKASRETIAAVDDDKDEDAELEEKMGGEMSSSSNSSSSSSSAGLATKSLKELALESPSILGTKLFWQQLAYFMVFVWEKKDGEAYKHGTAKSYYNCIHKLARNLVEKGDEVRDLRFFLDEANKPKSWWKKIHLRMEKHFMKLAAAAGQSLKKSAPPLALPQVVAGCKVSSTALPVCPPTPPTFSPI